MYHKFGTLKPLLLWPSMAISPYSFQLLHSCSGSIAFTLLSTFRCKQSHIAYLGYVSFDIYALKNLTIVDLCLHQIEGPALCFTMSLAMETDSHFISNTYWNLLAPHRFSHSPFRLQLFYNCIGRPIYILSYELIFIEACCNGWIGIFNFCFFSIKFFKTWV